MTSLYGCQSSFVAFACKTATLGPELQVSMCPRPHRWVFAFKTATLPSELQASMCPRLHRWVFAFKTATLAPELKVSMGAGPHLWFYMQNSDFWITIISLYGSQTSPVDL